MKHIFLDIDGTMISHTNGMQESTLEAIKEARARGNKVYICTGRTRSEMGRAFFDIPLDGIIAGAGSYIVYGDEILKNNLIDHDKILKILAILKDYDVNYVLEGVNYTYLLDIAHSDNTFLNAELSSLPDEVKKYLMPYKNCKDIEEYLLTPTPINKLVIYYNDYDDVYDIEKAFGSDYFFINYGHMSEIVKRGTNKAEAISLILDHIGVEIDQAIAIGDSINDYEMLKAVGLGIAMGNAASKLKEIADYITTDVDNNGIYNALKYFNMI